MAVWSECCQGGRVTKLLFHVTSMDPDNDWYTRWAMYSVAIHFRLPEGIPIPIPDLP
jgi:hypothetical protein